MEIPHPGEGSNGLTRATSPLDEAARLDALRQYDILDSPPEQEFDDLTYLAAQICGTPISAITLIDEDRQWYKSRIGLEPSETPRDVSFCAHTIQGHDLLVVPDTSADERFANNPFVTEEPHIRFYAGVPLVTPEGHAVGSLCVLDTVPRQLDPSQQDGLRRLGRQAITLLEARPEATSEKGQSRQGHHQSRQQRRALAAETGQRDTDKMKISEVRYRRLFEAAKDGILILDATTGKIEDVNPFLCQLLGYAPDTLIGQQLWDIGTFHDIAANQDAFHILQQKEYIRYDDLPLETKTGQHISVEFVSNVYLSGDKTVIQCNIRDVTERKRAAALLTESQQRLALATGSAHIGIWDWDVVANKMVWDAQMYALYGISAQDFSGAYDAWQAGLHPEDRVRAEADLSAALDGRRDFHSQFRVVWPQGEVHYIQAHAIVQRAANGAVLRMVGVNWDITERMQAEIQLLTSEGNLAKAQQIAHMGSWELDLANLNDINANALRWSDELFRIFGYEPGQIEVSNETFFRAVHPDDRTYLYQTMTEAIQGGKGYSVEHRIILPDGRERIVHSQSEMVYNEESGHPLKMVGLGQDITERIQVEQALQKNETKFRTIFETALDAILLADDNGIYVDANRAACTLLGMEHEQLMGRSIADFVSPTAQDATRTAWNNFLREGQQSGEFEFQQPNGSHRQAEYRAVAGLQPGIHMSVLRDITERKLAEATLLESEARFRTAIAEAPVPIMIHREDGKVLQISKGWTKYSGYDLEDVPTIQDWAERAYGRASAEAHEYIKKLYQITETRSEGEWIITAKNGQKRVWDFITTPLGTFGDNQRVVINTAFDITEREQAKEALEARTREIVTIWESMTDAFFTLDRQWCFTHVNSQAANLWQKNPEELIGKSIWDVFPPAEGSQFATKYRQALEEQVVVNFEAWYQPSNVWREVHAYPSSVGLSVYFRDITERKQAEAQLHFQKTLLEAQMEASLDGILVVDRGEKKKILSYNQRLMQMWGIPSDVAASGDDARLREAILSQVVNREETSKRAAYIYDHPTEHTHEETQLLNGQIFDRYSAPITDANGSHFGRVWFFRDITESKQIENTLRASEERFQSIIANVPGMVYQFSMQPDGGIAWPFVGQGLREIFEIEAELLEDDPYLPLDQIHPDDRSEFDRSVAVSRETLLPRDWEGRLRMASGRIKWVQVTSQPQLLADGSTLWNGLVMDITARKEAEEELNRFFELSLDMMCIAGFDGYFKRINPAFVETLGFTEAELLAKPFLEWSHPDDNDATVAAVETLSHANPVVGFENRYRTKDGSWRWLEWRAIAVPEEGLIYAAARDVTQRKEAESALQQMQEELEVRVEERTAQLAQTNAALQTQITEREEAEAETRTRARQQEAVADLGRQALTGVDMDILLNNATQLVTTTLDVELSVLLELMPERNTLRGRAVSGGTTNGLGQLIPNARNTQAGYALLHKVPIVVEDLRSETRFEPSPFLLGQGIISGVTLIVGRYDQPFGTLGAHTSRKRHFAQDDVNFLQAMANTLAAAIEQRHIQAEIHQLNGQLEETVEQLRIDNLERHMALGTLREVTAGLEQAKEEAELARENAEIANRAKSEFLSRMSHELRTPLNAILGFGQILGKQDLAPIPKESVGYILKGGRHLLDLINEVLDIARVEAGRLEISLEPIALDDVVPEACALLQPLAAQNNIRLEGNVSALVDNYILADRQRLKQVLINLVSNAIKYNREGGQVEISCNIKPDGWVAIAIRDTGMGIAPQDLPKLFTPFERLNASASEIEGTGLGLVLSQRLVTAMGGTLQVESLLGEGTTFTVELPQATSPEEQLAHLPQGFHHLETGKDAQLVFTVLCIEDNPSHIRLIELLFKDRPEITLLTAMLGSVGLDLARQHEPDLILLDLNLPDINGREILDRLQQSALTRDIPVVIISADATANQVERLLAAGARACLTKPLDVDQFLKTLNEFLQMTATNPA